MESVLAPGNCPTCKGTGLIHITVNTLEAGSEKNEPMALTCYECDGSGNVTTARAVAIADMQKRIEGMWCRCTESSGSIFHDDTVSAKHHYTCIDCGKVTQVG